MLRGGTPSAGDRILATQLGARAAELVEAGKFGYTVAKVGASITENRLEDIVGKPRKVDVNSEIVKTARDIGMSFGD
jgi:6-phosphofructokinase 1